MLRSPSRLLVAVQLVALATVSLLTAARFTVFAEVDEKQHYDYVQSVAEDGELPRLGDLVSDEAQAISARSWPRPSPVLPENDHLSGRSYEAFQPPLYYVAAAPAFLAVRDHKDKVTAVRVFDALLVLVAAALLWPLARALAPGAAWPAWAAGLLVLLWPGVVVRAVTISPSALELVLGTAAMLALWRAFRGDGRRWLVGAGALVGACLLTKSTLVYLVPVLLLVVALDLRRRRDWPGAVVAAVLPLVLLGPWLLMNHDRYGTWTASQQARAQQQPFVNPTGRSYDAGDAVRYTRRLFDNVLATEQAGQLDVWWVRGAVLVLGAGLLAAWLVLALTRASARRMLLFFLAPLAIGYLVMLMVLLRSNWPSFNLRYLYPVLPALAVAIAAAVPPSRRAWWAVGAGTALVLALWVDMAGAFYFTDLGDALGI